MRVRARDRLWEVDGVRSSGATMLLDLRRVDPRPAPATLIVAPEAEPGLTPEPPNPLTFGLGNPVLLDQLHQALALTMAHGRGDLVAIEHGRIDIEPYQLVPS